MHALAFVPGGPVVAVALGTLLTGVLLGIGLTLLAAFVAAAARANRRHFGAGCLRPSSSTSRPGPGGAGALPLRWLAVPATESRQLREALGVHQARPCGWTDGLAAARHQKLFISPPVGSWVLVMGAALPDPAADVDRCFHFLTRLSRWVGRVQFYALDPRPGHHAWALVNRGVVERAYAWAGQTLWTQGPMTPAERALGLVCFDYGEEPAAKVAGRRAALARNLERLPELAGRWSVNPAAVNASHLGAVRGLVCELSQRQMR